jgi:hypothetical protein
MAEAGFQKLKVRIIGAPETFGCEGRIRVVWQSRLRPPEHMPSTDCSWTIDVPLRNGVWSGSFVGRNSDGRRFLYFAWQNELGSVFRRIKLYQDQASGPEALIAGTMKDGSPACATAIILPPVP